MAVEKNFQNEFLRGVFQASPIVIAYFVLSIPFGILAVKMGLSLAAAAGMSIFVFAGAAQFIALQLIADNAGLWPIFVATFVINLRHFLMSMSLGCSLEKCRKRFLIYLAHTNTDETYGVNIIKEKPLHPNNLLGTNLTSHLAWIVGTALGALAGPFLPWSTKYFEALLPIMFAALLGTQIINKKDTAASFLSGLLTLILLFVMKGRWPFLIASLVAPAVMLFLKEPKK